MEGRLMSVSRRQLLDSSTLGPAPALRVVLDAPRRAASGWTLPRLGDVDIIENQWIELKDGERLAVQLWLPADAARRPAPVVMEMIPYRKRDQYRAYGGYWGRQLAQYGVAYARVDVRGSGDSTGQLTDEYLPREQADAVEAIAWLAAQPWSNGSVGMRGVSWGGFNTLQVAALAPPALKAVMPMCASDMRFTDDAHFVGGAFGLTGLKWASSFSLVMAAPPDPEITGEGWAEAWRARMDATPAIAAEWLRHQRNDAYWMQGSVAADYAAIKCPVYLVGGLNDPYTAAIPRLLAGLKAPRKALIGPWRHGYPSPASPGPALDWVFEEVRWWDHWLRGEDTGVMEGPMLRVYMPEQTASQAEGGRLPGRWVAEAGWPSANIRGQSLHLDSGRLSAAPEPEATAHIDGEQIVGLANAEWVPFARSELPGEQSEDDARSLTFDSDPLDGSLELLGVPTLRLRLTADQPVAKVAARLMEVDSEGRSWRLAYGILNLTHRGGHARPTPLVPGRAYTVELPLSFLAHRLRKGARLRLALSESLWPLVWPSPRTANLELKLADCRLSLPVRAPLPAEADFPIAERPAAPADHGPVIACQREGERIAWTSTWPESRTVAREAGVTLIGQGPDTVLTIAESDPNSGVWVVTQSTRYCWKGLEAAVESRISLRSTPSDFILVETLAGRRDGEVVFERTRESVIPRDLM
jgi:putative CocE/NonD family hydrolase